MKIIAISVILSIFSVFIKDASHFAFVRAFLNECNTFIIIKFCIKWRIHYIMNEILSDSWFSWAFIVIYAKKLKTN